MTRYTTLLRRFVVVAVLAASASALAATKDNLPVRTPGEDVDSSSVRNRQSLAPNENLLFSGWGVTPAGQHVPCGDIAQKLVIAPDKKVVLAVCAGYNEAGLNITSLDAKRQRQFIPIKEVFNGLAFSRDGKTFYVSGGDSGIIHVFNYADGKASPKEQVRPRASKSLVFLAGIAVHPGSGALYVCNEANHEIWVLSPNGLKIEKTVIVGQHPHSCVFAADGRHLYVSNWGSRSVSIIDTKDNSHVREIGRRPAAQRHGSRPRRPVVRGLLGRQHGARHRDGQAGKGRSAGKPHAAIAGRTREKSSPRRSTRNRPRGARPAAWPSLPTAERCLSPTPTTTT